MSDGDFVGNKRPSSSCPHECLKSLDFHGSICPTKGCDLSLGSELCITKISKESEQEYSRNGNASRTLGWLLEWPQSRQSKVVTPKKMVRQYSTAKSIVLYMSSFKPCNRSKIAWNERVVKWCATETFTSTPYIICRQSMNQSTKQPASQPANQAVSLSFIHSVSQSVQSIL